MENESHHTAIFSFLFFSFLFFSFLFFSFLFFSFLFFSFVAWLFEKRLFLPFLLDVVARLRCLQTAARKGIRKAGMCTRVCCLNTLQSSFEKRGKPCLSNKLFLFSFFFFLSFFVHHYHPQICFPSFLPSSSSSSFSSSSYCLLSCFVFKYSKSTFL